MLKELEIKIKEKKENKLKKEPNLKIILDIKIVKNNLLKIVKNLRRFIEKKVSKNSLKMKPILISKKWQ